MQGSQPQRSAAGTSTITCRPQIKGHSTHDMAGGVVTFMAFQWLQIRRALIVNRGKCSSDLTTPLIRAREQKSNQISRSQVTKQDYFVAGDSLFSNFAEDIVKLYQDTALHNCMLKALGQQINTSLSVHTPPDTQGAFLTLQV